MLTNPIDGDLYLANRIDGEQSASERRVCGRAHVDVQYPRVRLGQLYMDPPDAPLIGRLRGACRTSTRAHEHTSTRAHEHTSSERASEWVSECTWPSPVPEFVSKPIPWNTTCISLMLSSTSSTSKSVEGGSVSRRWVGVSDARLREHVGGSSRTRHQ